MKNIIIVVLALALVGAGAWFFLLKEEPTSAEAEKELTAEEVAELSIDTDIITTNLASAGHFGIVQFNILLSSEDAKLEAEKRKAEIRAAIISTVAGFTKEQLIGKEGIATLEKELHAKLSEIVHKGKVDRVLVTEFKVQ